MPTNRWPSDVAKGQESRKVSSSTKENDRPKKISINCEDLKNLFNENIDSKFVKVSSREWSSQNDSPMWSTESRGRSSLPKIASSGRSKSISSYGPVVTNDQQPLSNQSTDTRTRRKISVHKSPFRRFSDTKAPVIEKRNDDSAASRRNYTVNLHPGSYNVNIELRSKANPFSLKLSPNSTPKRETGIGVPPKVPEPLLYSQCGKDDKASAQTYKDCLADHLDKRPLHNHKARQRKEKHRWGSLSCFPLTNLDDSLSEPSGGDSFSGYEGVEHLKRRSIGGDASGISSVYDSVDGSCKRLTKAKFLPKCKNFFHKGILKSITNKTKYSHNQSSIDKHKLHSSCKDFYSIPSIGHQFNKVLDKSVVNNKRSRYEDEAFFRQVVDEYFADFCPTERGGDEVLSNDNCLPLNSCFKHNFSESNNLTKSSSDCYLGITKSSVASITALNSKRYSSCILRKTSIGLDPITTNTKSSGYEKISVNFPKNSESTSSSTIESESTNSWRSDDSLGYDADIEPSDRENYAKLVFCRDWQSAPTVCHERNNSNLKEHIFSDIAENKNNLIANPSFVGYAPRKSTSVGDARLVSSFVRIEKFHTHKLQTFINDSKIETKNTCQMFIEDDKSSSSSVYEDLFGSPNACEVGDDLTAITGNSLNFSNLEFTNSKYKKINDDLKKKLYRKSDTSTDEYSFMQSERLLNEGIVFNKSPLAEPIRKCKTNNLVFSNSKSFPLPVNIFENSSLQRYNTCITDSSLTTSENVNSRMNLSEMAYEKYPFNITDEINESKMPIDKKTEVKGILSDNYPIYYNLKGFRSKLNKKVSNQNQDVWQQKNKSTDSYASNACVGGSSVARVLTENMKPLHSTTYEHSSSFLSNGFKVKQSSGSVGRVQVRGLDPLTNAHVCRNSSLNSETEHLLCSQVSDILPTASTPTKVSEYIMGNVQSNKENSPSEDILPNRKPVGIKCGGRKKHRRKYLNSFLESFGASGGLSRNNSIQQCDSKEKNCTNNVDDSYSSNEVKCFNLINEEGISAQNLTNSCQPSEHIWTLANDHENSIAGPKLKKKGCKIISVENSLDDFRNKSESGKASATKESFSKIQEKQTKLNQQVSQPIYENSIFIKHHYLGKFSYINSLVQSENSDEDFTNLRTYSHSISKDLCKDKASNLNSKKLDCNFVQNDSEIFEDYGIYEELSIPPVSSSKTNDMDEFMSTRGSLASYATNLNGPDDDGNKDSDCSSENFSACRTASSVSIASDASSFYYTAGGQDLYDTIEATTKYFSLVEDELMHSDCGLRDSDKDNECTIKDDIDKKNKSLPSKSWDKSNVSSKPIYCDYVNANVLVSENKILVDIQPTDESINIKIFDTNTKVNDCIKKTVDAVDENESHAGNYLNILEDFSNNSSCISKNKSDCEFDSFQSSKGKSSDQINISIDTDDADLLENYFRGTGEFAPDTARSEILVDQKCEENFIDTFPTETESCSIYAPTTLSEPTSEVFNSDELSASLLKSESVDTKETTQVSFSSSECLFEEHQNKPTFDSFLKPKEDNFFLGPVNGPSFPSRRHTFQFNETSSAVPDASSHLHQHKSDSELPRVNGLLNLSSTGAKKPPLSPSHVNRENAFVPPEGRLSFKMRRRCRSFSSGGSAESTSVTELGSSGRPSSLTVLSVGANSSSSQESIVELPMRFSPARGDKAPNARWLAERKKNEGNELYKNKEYRDALKLYSEAIELCVDCAPYYSNRSACHMMLGKYSQALADAREAVRLDSTFVKGYVRIAKCNIALGDANAALAVLRQASEFDPNNKSLRDEAANAQALIKCCEEVEKSANRPDYRMAIFHLDRALNLASGCRHLKITKAEYLVFLQRYTDAQEIVNEILQFDSVNADAIYVRGMCLYYQNNYESANAHFQQVLRLAPDHKKAKVAYKNAKVLRQKKEEGNQAFNRGQLNEALRIYTEALAVDVHNVATNSKLYNNRATVRAKLGKLEEAIEDCTQAINLDEVYVKAFLRRAKCYQDLEKHEEAVRDYEKTFKLDRNQEHKRLLQEAKIQLKRSKWKDYYKILGVTKTATEDEIKKSYRKMALQHHPDRHASASDKEKQDHEVKFKEIGEAYTVLTDAKKKAMYDRGQDINDPDGGFGCDSDVDANQIFHAFFNQGFPTSNGYGGGYPGSGFGGGNMPGGFHFQFG